MNPENTFAYLIAVENYTDDKALHSLKQTYDNISELYDILRGPLVGIPPKKNIKRSVDPTDAQKLILEIDSLIDTPEAKTLIIYYAGHGVMHDDGKHYLTLSNSTVDKIYLNGLSIDRLSDAWAEKKNIKVILILDSCFSENAFDDFKGRNYLLLASSAKNRPSKYPVEANFSAFTGELISVMKEGVDIDSKTLTWRDIYQKVKENLAEKDFPAPKISAQNEVEMLKVCENRFNTNDVSMEDRWIRVIKEDIGKKHPVFGEEVEGYLNAGGSQVIKELAELLLNAFPSPIAYDLNTLFNKQVEAQAFYTFYESVIRFLFIIDFMQYERLKNRNEFKAGSKFRNQLMDFKKPDHDFYLTMLEVMSEDFKAGKAKGFIEEFDFFDPEFQEIISGLENEKNNIEIRLNVIKDYIFRLVSHLHFLLNYKLLSINDVNLSYRKYNEMQFNHSVSILQGNDETEYKVWPKPTEPWQKAFLKASKAKNSRSVIFMKCHVDNMGDYLNLWPLIIDKNVLEPSSTPEIYIYAGVNADDRYVYNKLSDKGEKESKQYDDLEKLAVSAKLDNFKTLLKS